MKVLKLVGIVALCAAVFVFVQAFIATSFDSASKKGQASQAQSTTAENPTINIHPNTTVQVTSVPVASFYNGQSGYSLSIPSGNMSTCTWTYVGGSAAVPYSLTTTANSATEKHVLEPDGGVDNYADFKVTCVDDFDNQYVGVFPK